MEEMGLKLPPAPVDLAESRRKYHAANTRGEGRRDGRTSLQEGPIAVKPDAAWFFIR